jgi:hypothetical protein
MIISYTPSESWETAPDWAQHVAEPVNRHLLAPREARAVLEHVGALLDHGWTLAALLARLPTPPTISAVATPSTNEEPTTTPR